MAQGLSRRAWLTRLAFAASAAAGASAATPEVRARQTGEKDAPKATLKLSLACIDNYDRTRALLDGTVKPEGIDLKGEAIGPADLFRRVAQRAEFQVSEMSTSTFMILKSQGDDRYVGIPVFPSRNFRHGYIFINRRSGIARPEDLAGKRIGAPEYQTTAALWQRSFLQDDYGIKPERIEWFEGGLDAPEPERYHVEISGGVHVQRIKAGETLSRLLEEGRLDAVMGPAEPECFRRASHIARLFPDYKRVEQDYFRRTKFFPIMHMLVLRNDVYRENPWAAMSIFKAFQSAKEKGMQRLWETWDLPCAVPWLLPELEETRAIFGPDHWPYGIAANQGVLERMTRASLEQGLSPKKLAARDLFARETWQT